MSATTLEIKYLKGVGEARSRLFAKLGITRVGDLLRFFPRDYQDRSVFKPIAETMDGETVSIRAMVATAPRLATISGGRKMVKTRVVDDSGAAELVFFNLPYVKDALKIGETYAFYGKIQRALGVSLANPDFEKADAELKTGRIVPTYPLTAGLNRHAVVNAVRQALSLCMDALPSVLPASVERDFELCDVRFAYENIHFPADFASLAQARRRFMFEELFAVAVLSAFRRRLSESVDGIRFEPCDMGVFYGSLPFAPTAAQVRAVDDAVRDCTSGKVMNRLVQGDVGSGKTLVAMALCYLAAQNGSQVAFMAPTELLAEQHFRTFCSTLEPLGLRVGLLTGSLGAKAKREVREALAFGQLDVIIGTHALISEGVEYNRLALVITDEQHRFGVNQRARLGQKGLPAKTEAVSSDESHDTAAATASLAGAHSSVATPHVFVMSATPIPRTLALILYGDLDVSTIDELPPGRQKIQTNFIDESKRERMYGFVRKLVSEGRQVYIVCPAIEENEENPTGLKSAREHAETLQSQVFPDLRVGLVHGAMKPRDKDAAMAAFVSGETQILVATTVVEVGVDVPNAALMVVENAERFGLSQLHQLRGRVGRGKHKSFCVLVEGTRGERSRERLQTLCATDDGFEIAEADLRQRGQGDFFGERQSGLSTLQALEQSADGETIIAARAAADSVLSADPELKSAENAPLRRRVSAVLEEASWTLN